MDTVEMLISVDDFIDKVKQYMPQCNQARIRDAYLFAEKAHAGQKRFSGEPYIVHPVKVAAILLEYHPDEDSIIAALLHDVAEDTPVTLDDIEKKFGRDVRMLCSGLMKLSKVRSRLNDPQIENLRKLFLSMAEDIRVILIKFCDRLHNMRTLQYIHPEKCVRIAQETLYIYAPIAARLGIYRLKTELEDLCFMYLHPKEYQEVFKQLEQTGKWRQNYIEIARKILLDVLTPEGIAPFIDGRVKGMYSIYRKLHKKNKNSIDEIFDIFAMRIVLPDQEKNGKEYTGQLYTTLGILHNNFTPLANRFKDYIAVPKVNGYRSLHTTVMGLGPKTYTRPTEIQIRSESMHRFAEFGIAAHWLYEEYSLEKLNEISKRHTWISGLKQIRSEVKSNQEWLEQLKTDTFQDRIFVLTPRGDVKDLPLGATPIDFAYTVHTEIGNRCVAARVNGVIVPIDYELRNGEVVEIITRKNAHPSQSWLAFVKTACARERIRNWFRNLDTDRHIRDGRLLVNEKLAQLGMPPLDDNFSILKFFEGKNKTLVQRKNLLREVGKGGMLATTLIKKIFTSDELFGLIKPQQKKTVPGQRVGKSEIALSESELVIGGQTHVPHTFVKCCNPTLQDELVGYVTRGQGVSIHRKDCAVLASIGENNRLVSVRSHALGSTALPYVVDIMIDAEDRRGLMSDASTVIAEQGLNIIDVFQYPIKDQLVRVHFIIEFSDYDQLERILSKLEKIPNIRRACKAN